MSAQITITLPEDVLQRAERWAERSGRPVADLLAETIEVSLRPLGTPPEGERPLNPGKEGWDISNEWTFSIDRRAKMNPR